jgi:hypothetical protein
VLILQLRKLCAMQSAQPAEVLEQALTNRDRVLAFYAHAHQDGNQLGVGQRLRTERGQPLARTVRFVQVGDAVDGWGSWLGKWDMPILQPKVI